MVDSLKPKIVCYPHRISVLYQYWQYLSDKADCWWATDNPYTYDELKQKGYQKIIFAPTSIKRFKPIIACKIVGRIWGLLKSRDKDKIVKSLINRMDPDICISDVALKLTRLNIAAMKVLVFHSVCYKRYYCVAENLKYDLLLTAGEYQTERMKKYLKIRDTGKIRVVGWPPIDTLINRRISKEERWVPEGDRARPGIKNCYVCPNPQCL